MKDFIYKLNRPENQDDKKEYVRNTFDSISPFYDLMNGLMSFGSHQYWPKYVVRKLKISSGERVLDVCCGTGDLARAVAAKVGREGKVFASDFSKGMLFKGAAKNRANSRNGNNILPATADTQELPFRSESFDAVTVAYGMRNLANLEQGLDEIYRVLKNGGRFGCLDLATPTIPIYSHLYHFYFFKVVPNMGKLVFGDKEPFSYLPNSVLTFPKQKEFKALMMKVGFRNTRYRNLAGETMVLHTGEKKE